MPLVGRLPGRLCSVDHYHLRVMSTMPRARPRTQAPGPLPGPVGRLASRLYGLGAAHVAGRFDRGINVTRLDRPVISVGNLSVGGTGKTPMVAWIVRTLLEAGERPVIAMRGYRSRGGRSDEALVYGSMFAQVPVVAQPDRVAGLGAVFASPAGAAVSCVVLDDGFQHRRIARDLDLVLIDGSRDVFADRLLPAGWLREPVSALARATHVAITHAELVKSEDIERMRDSITRAMGGRPARPSVPIAVVEHAWAGLTVHGADGSREEPVSWLRGMRAAATCGIGNPAAFIDACRRAVGGPLVADVVLPDHAAFEAAQRAAVLRAARGAQVLLMTAKDWVKWEAGPSAPLGGLVVAVPRLEMRLVSGADELRRDVLGVASSRR